MENILKELKEEIKKLSSEENLNVPKLDELMSIYQRLQGYQTTSVSQVVPTYQHYGFNPVQVPALPPTRNETATLYDGILKSVQEFYKRPNDSGTQIIRYIDWYNFLSENKRTIDTEEGDKVSKVRQSLYEKILNEIEKELNKETENVQTKCNEEFQKEINEIYRE